MRFAPIAFLLALAGSVPGQAQAFDVASVRMIEGDSLPPAFSFKPKRSAERLTWTTTRSDLVCFAYDVPAWSVAGLQQGPPYYRIEATMNPSASETELRAMLRRLLAERFDFTAHRETEERLGFTLAIDRKGHKLSTKTQDGGAPPMPDYLAGKAPEAFEGGIFTSIEGLGTSAVTGRGVPMSKLAAEISNAVSAFVLDQTGLAGDYYFGFRFLRDDPLGANSRDPRVHSLPIADALQDELGLRLEKTKGPVEILVVDRVEKAPTAN